MKPRQKPLIALFALDDNVRLGILPHSNKFVDGDCSNTLSAAIEYKFRRGEILLMHPALVHYGCAYTKEDNSLRAHLYFDNPGLNKQVGPQGQRTYLFKHKVKPMPKNQCIAKAQQTKKNIEQIAEEACKKAKEACKKAREASKAQTAANRNIEGTIRTRKQTLALSVAYNNKHIAS
jgi:hypothetical protein